MNVSPQHPISPIDIYTQNESTAIKTRSRRPCDSCRRRKSRCEMNADGPPCVLCRFHRQTCTFNEDPQPRKRKAASISEDDGNPQSHPSNTASARAAQTISKTVPANELPLQPTYIRKDPPVDDYANLRGPSLLKKTLGLQNHRHSRLIGSTSQYEQLLLELDAYNDKDEVPIGLSALRKVDAYDTAFILTPDEGTRNHAEEKPDLDAIETLVAPHGQALIHLYFRIVHPSFPILHKKVFLEKYQRTHREFSPPLLAAVYILALNWWSYSSELALLPKPDVPQLEKLAFKTINDIIHRPKLSTIQAGLLLLQRPEGDSWALTTQLVGLGQDLGMHLDCSDWRIPGWERGLRKRLAWALFMQDKWGSLVHGRPSHVTATDWAVQPLHEDDFPENAADEDDEDGSTEVEKGRALFCEMIKLTQILASILSTFYTLSAEMDARQHAHDEVRWILERAKPIQMSLKQWYAALPSVLRMEDLAMRKLSSTGYLHLGYFAVEITLHRRIVRASSTTDDLNLRSILRAAAQTRLDSAMEFVQSLRPEHLQSFWYSASKYCFALVGTFVSLLWVTAPSKAEADLYKGRLDQYRWTLRLSSKSADFLERAISMLATSTGVLIKAIPDEIDPDFVAHAQARRSASIALNTYRDSISASAGPGIYEQSESEFYEGPSPNLNDQQTPSTNGGSAAEHMPDQAWLTGPLPHPEVEAVYNNELDVALGTDYTELSGIGFQDTFNFQGFSGNPGV